MSKDPEEIKAYWDSRTARDPSAQSTTMGVWLKHIEANFVSETIRRFGPSLIHDVGCGDGLTTLHCA